MVVHMRHTRAHTRNRRSHHALTAPALSVCATCKASHLRHHACKNCGNYRGRLVIDVAGKRVRAQKRKEAKLKAMGEEVQKAEAETKTEEK